jgi:uncharacterized protein
VQVVGDGFVYSASDLNNDLECRRLTWLEHRVALGELHRPEAEGAAKLIAEKGEAHEARYRDLQRGRLGEDMVLFAGRVDNTRAAMAAAEAETLAAMERGAKLIYQATFFDGTFLGRTDFLRRVERPSARWAWSYEVVDTKLALSPKAYFLMQLCNYSEHLARLQGTPPRAGHLVLGSGLEASFRIDDYAAFYRHQKRTFLARAAQPVAAYPEETAHCGICRWADACEAQREADDYLGLVAWMRRGQIDKLAAESITTLPALAAASDDRRPFGMTEKTFATLRAQAALQHRQRTAFAQRKQPEESYFYELLDHENGRGFEQLPPPDAGDAYFDMEGDPLYTPERGLEYLFGVYTPDDDRYVAFWARDLTRERGAFEALIDFLTERRARFPNMHVYHYAPYETVALRRLMGSYGTREAELDDLLRGRVFVDLYAVVRQAVRISQPSYSIKKLEPFYGMVRHTDVKRGDDSIVNFETWLSERDDAILDDIERYNEDDCRSTHLLHHWLLERRAERGSVLGRELPWRQPTAEKKAGDDAGTSELARRLLAGLPDLRTPGDLRAAAAGVKARWLLGHLVQYHRREAKPAWWKMFDRHENVDRLTEFDHEALGDLTLCTDVAPEPKKKGERNFTYTYRFPDQLYNLGSEPQCPHTKKGAGTIVEIDDDRNLLRIKLSSNIVPQDLKALIPGGPMRTDAQEAALEAVALAFEAGTLRERFPAIGDLLVAAAPRFAGRPPRAPVQPATVTSAAVAELVAALDGSYLFVQGPPGSGKSTLGADVIVTLLAAGKRVGVVSRSHAAVHHLLHKVEQTARDRGVRFAGVYKHSGEGSAYVSRLETPMIASTSSNGDVTAKPHALAGGTPWLFAREDLRGAYDVLFIDEAGQLALGDALACATAARNVVLLGDPLQLAQVSQGSHPIGSGASVLEHLLGEEHTVPCDRGVFLDVSYRMHPAICDFISQAVYDGRLTAAASTVRHAVAGGGALAGSGLRFLPVEHAGNGRESGEEAERIADAVAALLRGEVTPPQGPPRPLTASDILIVTPYNAQRRRIAQTLAQRGLPPVAVGTVDKFQGQEAAVVFYSMATSSSDDLPRDLSFLFEKNRFNVAVSRAQALAVLVCSPRLLEVRCTTPAEMELASLLCAYVERSEVVA